MNDTIIIIDYGSQYTQLIARRIREFNVHSIILPYDYKIKDIDKYNVKGFILSGGPSSVYEKSAPYLPKNIFEYNVPILGVCYGFQLLIEHFNGLVISSKKAEYGKANVLIDSKSFILENLKENSTVWMSHGDKVSRLPRGWEVTSKSENGIISSAENNKAKLYGVQFHPEVAHTLEGNKIIENYLFAICKIEANWNSSNFVKSTIHRIRKIVGDK